MSKKIQIGYDKVPAPVTEQFQQLVDIRGEPLFDAAGNPLVTQEDSALSAFANAAGSLSTVINNVGAKQAIPVVEQFPSESEVSNSLLGVPRAEEQLSLFSDVSTYGFDADNWNFYSYIGPRNYPTEWYNRSNPFYGERTFPTFEEETDEQALYYYNFPVQWTFPDGPVALQQNEPTNQFREYLKFIAVGKFLYNKFQNDTEFANRNLIDDTIQIVDSSGDPLPIIFNQAAPEDDSTFTGENTTFFDITYGDDLQKAFDMIERYTVFISGVNGASEVSAIFPEVFGEQTDYTKTDEYAAIEKYLVQKTRGGASAAPVSFGVLESKKSYRYQPGRISAFTFGVRAQVVEASSDTVVEFGAANSTDQYVFQIKGTDLNIVRRSVIPLGPELLARQGINDPTVETEDPIYGIELDNEVPLYEAVITRQYWNGDPLDGTGRSGYIINPVDVTMYKVEFSWYGAIGAKFYAYVPVENGEARWVLLHTLVIENGMGGPSLKNPNMKFKYIVYSTNTAKLLNPTFIYKYGSSYYIDGGDEGTVRLSTFTTEGKALETTRKTPVLGILPKEKILNQDGDEIENAKQAYPDTVSVKSDTDVRIDIEEVNGSFSGQHYGYSIGLNSTGRHPYNRELDFYYNSTRSQLTVVPRTPVTTSVVFDSTAETLTVSGIDLTETFQTGDIVGVSGDGNASSNNGNYFVTEVTSTALTVIPSEEGNEGTLVDGTVTVTLTPSNFNLSDNYAKVIADGVYNTYVLIDEDTPDNTTADILYHDNIDLLTDGSYSYQNQSSQPDQLKIDGETVLTGPDVLEASPSLTFSFADGGADRIVLSTGLSGFNLVVGQKILVEGTTSNNGSYTVTDVNETGNIITCGGASFVTETSNTSTQRIRKIFTARLVNNRAIVASTVPIQSSSFVIHWLNPSPKDDETSGRHYAEFGLTFTYGEPTTTDGGINGRLEFEFPGGTYRELDLRNDVLPLLEYSHEYGRFSFTKRAVDREWDPSYGEQFMVDNRLPGPLGGDSGYVSAVRGDFDITNHRIAVDAPSMSGPNPRLPLATGDDDNGFRYVVTYLPEEGAGEGAVPVPPAGIPEPERDETTNVITTTFEELTAEIGVDNAGSGVFYVTPPRNVNGTVTSIIEVPSTFDPADLDTFFTNLRDREAVQTKTLTISDEWNINSFNEDGEPRFPLRQFAITRALVFNSQPLYAVFALKDYSEIRGIAIEQADITAPSTQTPTFIKSDTTTNLNLAESNFGASNTLSPPNFVTTDRLSGVRYDASLTQPLRPSNVISSFYVERDVPTTLDLKNVFNFDRKFLARGLLNNTAIYFTATRLDSAAPVANAAIEMSVTTKEQ